MKLSISASILSTLCVFQQVSAFVPSQMGGLNNQIQNKQPTHLMSTLEPPTAPIIEEVEVVEVQKTYLDDGFVFGLEGSGLSRPKGKVSQVVVEGDSLETQPYQMAAVAATFFSHASFAGLSINHLLDINGGNISLTAVQSLICIVSSWVAADFGSGVLHWSVDNYGNGKTPVMGNIIAAFQGHHSAPWTITEREFCNNVHKLCIPFGIPTVALIAMLAGPSNPLVTLFFTVFCSLEIGSQEFHKWSHMTKKQLPPVINKIQDLGLTVGKAPHALHHLAPFEGNYCIVSGFCNSFLDRYGIFRRMEHVVYNINGVESNSWKLDPELRSRTLSGQYMPVIKRRRKN